MRISDWSSDVCSSDLVVLAAHRRLLASYPDALLILVPRHTERFASVHQLCESEGLATVRRSSAQPVTDRKSVVEGKSGSVRVVLGGRRILKNKNMQLFTPYQLYCNRAILTQTN